MNIFRQLRWKLTLSYTLVTVGAFLVITLILGGIFLTQIFLPESDFNPEQLIDGWMNNRIPSNYPLWSQILSQSPVDMDLINLYVTEGQSTITNSPSFRIGALQLSVSTTASIRVLVFGPDGILLATNVPDDPLFHSAVGQPFDPDQVPGLEAPFKAALAGDTDPKHLYTMLVPNQQGVMAAPIFSPAGEDKNQLVGVMVILFDAIPTQRDIPAHILNLAGRSLVIFLLGAGIMGAIFGAIFANGLTKRFSHISATTDLWSTGDFSRYVVDTTGDEITQFAQRLNNMAKQLQSLLRRRQEMAVSEERNRLARDLHDSAKQQALAASLELGTALTLYERDPQGAKKHLVEADALVDAVRKELTNLVHELRPQDMDGQDFAEILKEHAMEWSHRSGIELNINIEGNDKLSLATRETLFRIAQEALANIARHSSASCADVFLEYEINTATLIIKDDGRGFDTCASHSGVGLASMRERAEVLGGNFIVESAPGQGTKIVVTLPVEG
jgi:NarL family two-component system sensor histidine kinase LiaS